ncbi:Hpt domain-containing protein [bacterium]|nr:Hpt domain-containing protein [bacterium]
MELSKEEMIEVMAVFKGESEEHLKILTEKVAVLESNPKDTGAIELLHRTSHSMKGAARMMGLTPIESIGHALEDGFKAVKDGKPLITTDMITNIKAAIDGVRQLIDKLASEGTTEGFDVSGILKKLEYFK